MLVMAKFLQRWWNFCLLYFAITSDKWVSNTGGKLKILIFWYPFFGVAWLSLFSVIHLLCAWFTFTFQLDPCSLHVYIHFSIKFTFTFQLDLLCWEGRRTQVDLHGQLLVSSSISCPQTQIQFQLEIFRSWDKLIFFYQNCTRSTREEDWFMIFVTRWGLMVLTTVGYGEKVPHTWAGQVIHTLAARQLSCAFFCIPGGYQE